MDLELAHVLRGGHCKAVARVVPLVTEAAIEENLAASGSFTRRNRRGSRRLSLGDSDSDAQVGGQFLLPLEEDLVWLGTTRPASGSRDQ